MPSIFVCHSGAAVAACLQDQPRICLEAVENNQHAVPGLPAAGALSMPVAAKRSSGPTDCCADSDGAVQGPQEATTGFGQQQQDAVSGTVHGELRHQHRLGTPVSAANGRYNAPGSTSPGSHRLDSPVTSMTPSPGGHGQLLQSVYHLPAAASPGVIPNTAAAAATAAAAVAACAADAVAAAVRRQLQALDTKQLAGKPFAFQPEWLP